MANLNQNINNAVKIPFCCSNAIGLSRAMMAVLPPILRDILDALSFEKWERIKRIAEIEVKYRRGEMQINVAGYGFTVNVQKGSVRLVHRQGMMRPRRSLRR